MIAFSFKLTVNATTTEFITVFSLCLPMQIMSDFFSLCMNPAFQTIIFFI